ncbi:hypothetical protein M1295_01930 [Patescibacteria group bacterium]|nr:hypothetical protein [Patescibacteria group bacterium]
MSKNKIFAVMGIVVMTALAVVPSSFAQTASTTVATASSPSEQMVLQVGPGGKVLMRGTIASASSGALTVNSWGGVWTVNVGSAVQVLPTAAGNDLTKFKAGDFVGILGTVSQSAPWTIDATLVRDWTYRSAVTQQEKQNANEASQIKKASEPRDYVGTASSSVSGNSFTFMVDGMPYTVNVDPNAEVVNRNWVGLTPAGIQNGDNVRVWGTSASGTISAQIIRDVSIPTTAKAPASH